MNDFICISISIKMECYMFLFIETTGQVRRINHIQIFSIESSKSFTLFLFNFLHKFMILTTFQQTFAHLLIFSEYYT